jgi:tRNA nucleotidyltransferase/poly(A) polymerase
MRAVRFHAQLGFEIEEGTLAAVQKLSPLVASVSKERVRDEMLKLLRAERRAEGMRLLASTGLLAAVLPDLRDFLLSPDWNRSLATLGQKFHLTQEVNLWAAFGLYLPAQKLKLKDVLKELKCSNYVVSYVDGLVSAYWKSLDARAPRSVLLRLLAQFGPDLLELHRIQAGLQPPEGRWTELSPLPLELPEPLVTSADLKAAGVAEGPRFGKILEELFDLQLNGELADRDQALERLAQLVGRGG